MFERSRKGEHALLIQTHAGGPPEADVMEEFAELARSAGATIAGVVNARIDKPNAAMLVGSGKLDEIKAACEATGADLVIVNHPLRPSQERNLEKALERRVIDRTGLILDIFSQRAQSAEGKLQVELAQLKHMSTRLIRGWTHLERQRGGSIGLRGPGETQLETDRRLLQKRLEQLQKRLDKVEVQRTQMRRARVRSELPRVALVGYTNAGKSTLFNAMTGASAFAADQLFATLDPTVRRVDVPGGHVVLADTVGFVRDLPHELVAAFRSTLSEAREADLLIHVVDAADPLRDERMAQVDAVLAEIGAGDLPQVVVFNKLDRLVLPPVDDLREPHEAPGPTIDAAAQDDAEGVSGNGSIPAAARSGTNVEPARSVGKPMAPRIDRLASTHTRVWLSARDGTGLDLLREVLGESLDLQHVSGDVHIPSSAARLRSRLHDLGAVRSEEAVDGGWMLRVDLPHAEAHRLFSQAHGEVLRELVEAVPVPL